MLLQNIIKTNNNIPHLPKGFSILEQMLRERHIQGESRGSEEVTSRPSIECRRLVEFTSSFHTNKQRKDHPHRQGGQTGPVGLYNVGLGGP